MVRSRGDGEQQPEQLPRHRRRFGPAGSIRLQRQLVARIITGRRSRGSWTRSRRGSPPLRLFPVQKPTYNKGFCREPSSARGLLQGASPMSNVPNIDARGYAHPEVLVSTDWVAAHLNDPSVRIIESNEDTLLYASGHI